jgi:hypothetical protein
VTQSKGELGVRWKDGTLEVTSRDATYDFGKAAVGDRVPKQLIISNQGSGPLTVQTLELTEGDKVKVGDAAVEGAAFEVQFAEDVVPAGEEKLFQMFYAPPMATDATQLKATHLSKLLLTAANAPEGENTAVITLKGEAEQGSCALPAELDFGKVTVGETFPAVIALTNGMTLDGLRRQAGRDQRGPGGVRLRGRLAEGQLLHFGQHLCRRHLHLLSHGSARLHRHRDAARRPQLPRGHGGAQGRGHCLVCRHGPQGILP